MKTVIRNTLTAALRMAQAMQAANEVSKQRIRTSMTYGIVVKSQGPQARTPEFAGTRSLSICFRQEHGSSDSSITMTAHQMPDLALVLNSHANRLDELKHELDYLQTEAA